MDIKFCHAQVYWWTYYCKLCFNNKRTNTSIFNISIVSIISIYCCFSSLTTRNYNIKSKMVIFFYYSTLTKHKMRNNPFRGHINSWQDFLREKHVGSTGQNCWLRIHCILLVTGIYGIRFYLVVILKYSDDLHKHTSN